MKKIIKILILILLGLILISTVSCTSSQNLSQSEKQSIWIWGYDDDGNEFFSEYQSKQSVIVGDLVKIKTPNGTSYITVTDIKTRKPNSFR